MKLCFLINPNSGKKKSTQIFKSIRPILNKKKIDFDYFETNYKNHAKDLIYKIKLDQYDGLIIIGGDGTFHEAVNGLMIRHDNLKIPIGIIPGGSGNSFLFGRYKKKERRKEKKKSRKKAPKNNEKKNKTRNFTIR